MEDASRQPAEEAETAQENVESQPAANEEAEVPDSTPVQPESIDVSAPADACAEDTSANTAANGPVDNEVLTACYSVNKPSVLATASSPRLHVGFPTSNCTHSTSRSPTPALSL